MLDRWSQAASEAWDVGRVGRLTLSFEGVVFTIQANVVKCMEEKTSIDSGSQIVLRRPRSNPNSQCLFKALCRPDSPFTLCCNRSTRQRAPIDVKSVSCGRIGGIGWPAMLRKSRREERSESQKNREKGAEKRGRGERVGKWVNASLA